ncbi:hypothetical protein RHMOL_Rhmol05G0129600 [Rhododendron molle]|uniref:Uncharacterized protein n=1 Tax=Rhododendron molle TaxID=49168 RepID=A0ACC0NQU3_RHOML|nr:hypothetical protein RHMOL_Rhmol05G0129600 [Rhododendron molle]
MAQFSDLDHAFEGMSVQEVPITPILERISTGHIAWLKKKKLLALLAIVTIDTLFWTVQISLLTVFDSPMMNKVKNLSFERINPFRTLLN